MNTTNCEYKINSTICEDYDFIFYRSINYNINNPINIITIKLNVEKERQKRFYYYLNKSLSK